MGMQNLLPGSKKRERGLGISFVRMRNYIALFNSHGACFKNVEPVVTAQENISIYKKVHFVLNVFIIFELIFETLKQNKFKMGSTALPV